MNEQPPFDTLLLLASASTIGGKTHTPAGSSDYDIPEGPFTCARAHVENLADLADFLAATPFNAFHVRGATFEPNAASIPYRRTQSRPGAPATLLDHAHHTIPIDFDSPNTTAADAPMADLYESATYVRALLPPPFDTAACIAQATGNAGIKPGARVRLWYFANRPVSDKELRSYFENAPVDTKIYYAHQPIYIAAPRFIGLPDPFPRRFTVLPGPDLEVLDVLVHSVLSSHTPAGDIATALQGISGNIIEGNRNASLTSIAGSMRHRGLEPAAILAALISHNETNVVPPLPQSELEHIANSVGNYEPTGVPILVPKSSKAAERALKRHTQRVFEDPGLLASALQELKGYVVQGLLTETQVTTRMCAVLEKEGTIVPESDVLARLRSAPLVATAAQAEWQTDLLRNEEGSIRIGPYNQHLILRKCPDFECWYDTRADEVQWTRAPWIRTPRPLVDTDDSSIRAWFDKSFGWPRIAEDPIKSLRLVSRDRSWDPWTEGYLDRLVWDGTPRLAQVATQILGATTERENITFAWWLISSVARSYEPGCQVDHMIILEGHTGAGKTSFLNALVGSPRYYARVNTAGDLNNPRNIGRLQGPVVMELAELASLSRRDVEATKEFLDARHDMWQPLYSPMMRTSPRRVVFAGTTNNSEYLRDVTSARRFWPIKIGARIDLALLVQTRDQIWAEAVYAYRAGVKWYPTPEESERLGLREAQEDRRELEIGEESIHDILAKPHVPGQAFGGPAPEPWMLDRKNRLVRCTLSWLQAHIGRTGHDPRPVAKTLTAAGWTPTRACDSAGRQFRCWYAPGHAPREGRRL